MKLREFNKLLRSISDKKTGLLDMAKITTLTIEQREAMVYFIIRNRQPIVKDLIPLSFDFGWLFSMGYLYETKGKHFTFIHTSEQRVK